MDFCHLAPTAHLDLVQNRPAHLTLAHLVERDDAYVHFYQNERAKAQANGWRYTNIMDNSAFEMWQQKKPMLEPDVLLRLAEKVGATHIVMSDYPDSPAEKTIDAAIKLAPTFHNAGFKTFFVPQAPRGDVDQLIGSFYWAAQNKKYVDYVGISILSAPIAFNVNKPKTGVTDDQARMQYFFCRYKLVKLIQEKTNIFHQYASNDIKIHMLGMLDGPNEINHVRKVIEPATWDSSTAVWHGLNGIAYDDSLYGLAKGKLDLEVDFNFRTADNNLISIAQNNIEYIDTMSSDIW